MQRFPIARKLLKEKGYANDNDDSRLKKLPKWLKAAYLKDIDYCESGICYEKGMEIHRIKRGSKGGLYTPSNIKISCHKHHKMFHYKEFK